jgi:peptide/nickel transport system permease protein
LSQDGQIVSATTAVPLISEPEAPAVRRAPPSAFERAYRNTSVIIGGVIVLAMIVIGLLAPLLSTLSPTDISPAVRNKTPGFERTVRNDKGEQFQVTYRMGTDSLGRDVYSRVLYGARVSIFVGVTVAFMSVTIGLFIGLVSGYFRWVDPIVMRIMDGLMAIPAILLAIALVSLTNASVFLVIVAITIPEIPRVVRLVRSVVLSVREQPFVEAAVAGGAPIWKILIRHVMPSTFPPLIVQATYICASAILIEASLSFLGAGTPPEIPTWGNMVASSRLFLQRAPWTIFAPGLALALVVLAVNLVGDGLRDRLDPRLARRM